MCGILGIIELKVGNNQLKVDEILKKLFQSSERRGKEASGFCFANKVEVIIGKTSQPASKLINTADYKVSFNKISNLNVSKEESLINLYFGHARLVTHGYEQYQQNNQPVYSHDIVLVHNGIVVNYKDLWNKYSPDSSPKTELDTEVIPMLFRKFLNESNSIAESINKIFNNVKGVVNIALYDVIKKKFILASNNGSLFYYRNPEVIVFASEKQILSSSCSFVENENDIIQVYKENILELELNTKNLTENDVNIIDVDKAIKKKYYNSSLEFSDNIEVSDSFLGFIDKIQNKVDNLKRCTKCLLPETFPGIHFDEEGVCNVCHTYPKRDLLGNDELMKIVSNLPQNKPVLVAFSGGRDSSYCLHYLKKELGLNCIAYSYDWGMLTDLGRRNQSIMCSELGVEHILVSADIRKKRRNIRLNVEAWLKKPSLGMIPLFMAGDKQYFYYAYQIMKEKDASCLVMGENYLERTGFKTAFSGAKQTNEGFMAYHISLANKMRMISYYLGQYISNPSYINKSLIDTFSAAKSYYGLSHEYLNLFKYIPWVEEDVDDVLINKYGWETDPGVESTWRIGDGTAAFYNYIYYVIAGFSEADTFRSNQIREGLITREKALSLLLSQNKPRWGSIKWYCDAIGLDFEKTIKIINNQSYLK